MIEWRQKLKLKEIRRASNKTLKNPWTQNLTPPRTKNIFCFNSDILYTKTTSNSFEYPLKSILKSSHPKNYLLISGARAKLSSSKNLGIENLYPHPPPQKKFLPSPPSLKMWTTPLPPPPRAPPERSTRFFLDVGGFVEKERATKPYKFGTVREAHARANVEREPIKQRSVKCVVMFVLRSTD